MNTFKIIRESGKIYLPLFMFINKTKID